MTMISIGKGDVGISKMTTEVFDIMERLPKMVEGVTGVDIATVGAVLVRRLHIVICEDDFSYYLISVL